jgi:hypothetical protein
MSAKFTANIEEDKNDGGWLIRLTDTMDDRVAICKSLEEFKTRLEELGDDYGGDVEVSWSKEPDVTDKHFKEIHDGMADYKEEETEDKTENLEIQEVTSGFNPNA